MAEDPFAKARFQPTPGPMPLYYQVYLHLRGMLDDELLKAADRLPGERELCEFYGCSLITMRRALDELTRERRLVRMRGRGTFVTEPPLERNLALLDSFTQEMHERGRAPATRVLEARSGTAAPAEAAALHLEPGDPTIVLERLRLVDDQPLVLEEVHLSAARFPGLLDQDLENDSLYELLAMRYETRLEYAQETIEAVALSSREAALLGDKRGRPALLLLLVAFDQDGRPVEYCRSLVRGDRARYHVDARRRGLNALQMPS